MRLWSTGRRGLLDFVLQRLTALVLGLYALCVLGFLLSRSEVTYAEWVGFMGSLPMTIFSTVSLLSLGVHAWIGMWTIGTDYIRTFSFGKRSTFLRQGYQAVIALLLLGYVIWGNAVSWGLS